MSEENAALRYQLADIQTSLQQLTHSNEATLQDIQVTTNCLPVPAYQGISFTSAVICFINDQWDM